MTTADAWQLDKRLAAVILTIVLQTGGAIWWASAVSSAIHDLTATDVRLERQDEQLRAEAVAREARLRSVEQGAGRLEAKLESISEGIDRLNAQIERLLESQP